MATTAEATENQTITNDVGELGRLKIRAYDLIATIQKSQEELKQVNDRMVELYAVPGE